MMINKSRHDNRGSSLITVIVCIAFITILSTLLLTLTVNNIQMKAISRKAKANFYVTEKAFDEIKVGLQEVVANELENAYEEVLKQYLHKTLEEKEKIFSKTFVDGLAKKLGGDVDATTYNLNTMESYIKQSSIELKAKDNNNYLVKDIIDISNPKYMTLKNVQVSYTDANRYKTTITSDISINTPSMVFNSVSNGGVVFKEYGIIADNQLLLKTAPNVTISGNVYSGDGGILIDNASSLLMEKASKIITRGDINVAERSVLQITNNPSVWINSIGTKKGTNTEDATSISIEGKCYVADDLTLNARVSDVAIKGEYYGYNYLANTSIPFADPLTPQSSSSIIINGARSNLDLSGVDKLLIAGRAFLDPKSNKNESNEVQDKIETGESLAIKGNQYAYLIPSEYLWCDLNPVPRTVYDNGTRPLTEVDYNKVLTVPSAIDISQYADGYSKIFYKAAGQDLVYYYIKFKSQEKANEYVRKYYEVYNNNANIGVIDNRIKSFAKSIKIKEPMNSLISSGNIFTFNEATGKSSLTPNTVNPDVNTLQAIAKSLAKRYDFLKRELSDVATGEPYDETSMFKTIVHTSNIDTDNIDTNYPEGVKTVNVDSENVVYIVDNDGESAFIIEDNSSLPNMGRQGIVIATGSVEVKKDYKGLIISGKDIELKPGVKVTASNDVVNTILRANNPQVNRYFIRYAHHVGTGADEDGARVNVSSLIVYDNWKLNED